MDEKHEIGFIGIGNMGEIMVPRLINAGYRMAVYDKDRERQAAFAEQHNCRSAGSLGEVGDGVDFIYTMLPDGHAARNALVEAEDGALVKMLKPGSVILDSSSCDPLNTVKLAEELAERGIMMVDAPVSGGVNGARDGELVFMTGADDETALERCRPVLEELGKHLFVVGRTGAGHAMKALNNYVSGTGFLAGVESLVIGRAFGLDPSLMVDVYNVSTGRNFASQETLKQHVISRKFGTGFQLGLMAKDVKIAGDLAEELGVTAPLIRQSREVLLRARETIGFGVDHTEALKYWEKLNGWTLDDGK
ncbi:MAG: 2-hydroxy-3-oxopropionate reductase [Rhodospirillaceae bacterium]|nr:2-hydroxy-3-oxopropionate reductase [Rhodospirillaceae bacterium]